MANVQLSKAERLDQYITRTVLHISRAYAVKLIESGKVSVNGAPQIKAGHKLRQDDVVIADYDAVTEAMIPEIDLEVLYEDSDCVVIVKPTGVLTHSKGVYNPEASVASWLASRVNKELADSVSGPNDRAGIVHRLDRATSGVMICAKNAQALKWLQKQFAERKVSKTYYAVVQGKLDPVAALIDLPIQRDPKKPQTFRVGSNGKSATTEYKIEKTGSQYSLLHLAPKTGRTHQLRVHLAYVGHPIVGDTLYNGKTAERLYLHAYKLELNLSNIDHTHMVFTAPLPPAFKNLVDRDVE